MTSALELTVGSGLGMLSDRFNAAEYKPGVSIDDVAYTLPFAKPVVVAVEPGFHLIEFFMQRPPIYWQGTFGRLAVHEAKINIPAGVIQPFHYRIHTSLGFILNLKASALEQYEPRPIDTLSMNSSKQGQCGPTQPQQEFTPAPSPPHISSPIGPQTPEIVFCIYCGTVFNKEHRYCGACGQQRNAEEALLPDAKPSDMRTAEDLLGELCQYPGKTAPVYHNRNNVDSPTLEEPEPFFYPNK